MLNKNIFGILTTFCLMGLVIIGLPGCSKKIVNENTDSNVTIAISTKASAIEMSELANLFILTVEADDIPVPLFFPLTLEGSFLTGQVIVPVGLNRKFIINAYNLPIDVIDFTGTLIYQGTDSADVIFNSTVTVNIDMFPVVPLMKVIPRINSERISSMEMGQSFVADVYVYNVPDVNYVSFNLSCPTTNSLINYFDVKLGADVPADSRVSHEGGGASVTVWLDRPNLAGPLVDALGNAHLLTFYFNSHSDTDADFDTTTTEINQIILDRGSGDLSNPFPLDSLYLESATVELIRPIEIVK